MNSTENAGDKDNNKLQVLKDDPYLEPFEHDLVNR